MEKKAWKKASRNNKNLRNSLFERKWSTLPCGYVLCVDCSFVGNAE